MKGTAKNKLGKIDKNYIKCAVINCVNINGKHTIIV